MSFRLSARTYLVAGLVCLQAADLTLTYLLLDGGRRADVYEANPLARSILQAGGWLGMALFKSSLTGVTVVAALLVWRRRPAAAAWLLGLLCAVVLGVNVYSGTLLASPGAEAAEERRLNEAGEELDRQVALAREFAELREAICDDLLDGKCDVAKASGRLAGLVADCGPKMRLPGVARLPEPSRPGELRAYLSFHLYHRAVRRGVTGRLAGLGPPALQARGHDPHTPRWLSGMN